MAVTVCAGKRSYNLIWNIGKIKSTASNVFHLENSKWCFMFETDISPLQKEEDWKMYLKKIHPNDGNHAFTISVYAEDKFKKLECLSFTRLNVEKSGIQQILWRRKSNVMKKYPYLKLDGDANLVIAILSEYQYITEIESYTDSKFVQTSTHLDMQQCLECLSKDFGELRENGSETDFELRCGDNTLHVHKAVLIARSQVFAAMLQSDMLERGNSFVDIVDMEYSILDIFLRYVYTGTLPNTNFDTCTKLYEVADQYGVDSLKTHCALLLKESLTIENACDILVLADNRCDDELKEYVTSYIIQKDILTHMEDEQLFSSLHPKLAVDVLYQAYKIMKLTLTDVKKK